MSVWWVNLGQRFAAQKEASALWCPNQTVREDGSLTAPAWHWSAIEGVKAGEFIILCRHGYIEGLAIAREEAIENQEKPQGFTLDRRWHGSGWLLPVEFIEFSKRRPRDELTSGLFRDRVKYMPVRNNPETGKGLGAQIYMTRLRESEGDILFSRAAMILDVERQGWLDKAIRSDASVGNRPPPDETTRTAIVKARIGQGQFRQNLLELWNRRCCSTDLDIEQLLVASHIHPWSCASNEERLDPYNGLLLSAAYDAAFDKGLITLSDDGTWINAANLTDNQLASAGLGAMEFQRVEGLNEKHAKYLNRHRERAREIQDTKMQVQR
ncbi:HNH endonuclease [Aurantimonas litoralis]|nr:HNH endonuclease [Aurantimonas litoralis]